MLEAKLYEVLSDLGYEVYPVKIPQTATYPVIVYSVAVTIKKQPLNSNEYLEGKKRVQVDIFAKSYKQAKEITEEVCDAIKTLDARDVQIIDLYEEDVELYREVVEFYIKEEK